MLLCVCACPLSHVRPSATPWTVACQAPLSVEFSRQEYWSGLPFPTLGNLPDPGIESIFLVSPALACRFLTIGTTWEAHLLLTGMKTGAAPFKTRMVGFYKVAHILHAHAHAHVHTHTPYRPAVLFLGIYPREMKTMFM